MSQCSPPHHTTFILVTFVCSTSLFSAAAVQCLHLSLTLCRQTQLTFLCGQKLLCVFMGYSHYNGSAFCTDDTGRVKRNLCKAAGRGCTEISPSCMGGNEVMAYQKETFNYISSDKPFISVLC